MSKGVFSAQFVSIQTFKRSEEHTSELQSRPHLVCRLLLEKKNGRCPARHAVPARAVPLCPPDDLRPAPGPRLPALPAAAAHLPRALCRKPARARAAGRAAPGTVVEQRNGRQRLTHAGHEACVRGAGRGLVGHRACGAERAPRPPYLSLLTGWGAPGIYTLSLRDALPI